MIIKLRSQRRGDHVDELVYVGDDADHLALAGRLTFRIPEWQIFGATLLYGAQKWNSVVVEVEGDEEVIGDADPA